MDDASVPCCNSGHLGYTHIGWIPCISGHIDFSLMKVGLVGNFIANKIDQNPISINFAASGLPDNHVRRVVMQSWVDWRDKLEGDGEFRVIVVAEGSESRDLDGRNLCGSLLMFPKAYSKQWVEHHDSLLRKVHHLKKLYQAYRSTEPSQTSDTFTWLQCQAKLNDHWLNLTRTLAKENLFGRDGNEVYRVDFKVDHFGFTLLEYRNTAIDLIDPIADEEKYIIIRQAFYYIKYSLHKHKHHVEESDALTTIVSYSDATSKAVATQLLGQLKRELVRIKRTQRQNFRRQDDSEAMGILGYMRSLLSSCYDNQFINNKIRLRELGWIEGMERSFTAQNERIGNHIGRRNTVDQGARQWVAYLLAFIAASTLVWFNIHKRLLPEDAAGRQKETRGLSDDILNIVTEHYFTTIFVVFMLLLAAGEIYKSLRLMDISNARLLRNLRVTSWSKAVILFGLYSFCSASVLGLLYFWISRTFFAQ